MITTKKRWLSVRIALVPSSLIDLMCIYEAAKEVATEQLELTMLE